MTRPAALALACLAALLAAPPARAEFEVEVIHDGPDRPRLLLAPRPAETSTLVLRFETGSVDDGGLSGLTRLSQAALLAANQRLDRAALFLELHAAAATLRMETGPRSCQFVLTAPKASFWPLARRLIEAVLAPRLLPAALPGAAARAIHEALPERREADLAALVAATAFTDGRYRNRPEGDRQVIETLGAEDVQDHLAAHFAPAHATVVLAGTFPRAEALGVLRRFRGGQPREVERPALVVPIQASLVGRRLVNVTAFRLPLHGPRDAAAARLLAAVLEGELTRTFRDAGVGYGSVVAVAPAPWLDLLVVALPAQDPAGVDLRKQLQLAIERVRRGRPDEATVARDRAAALAGLRRTDRDPEALALALADGGEAWHGPAVAQALASPGAPGLGGAADWLDPAGAIEITFGGRRR